MPTNNAQPANLSQWAQDYLIFIGAPASGPNDPRVKFLEKWGNHEDYAVGNVNNPLGIEQGTGINAPRGEPWAASLPTSGSWNSAGVATYPDYSTGLAVTQHTMQQGYDAPIYAALRNPSSSSQDLTNALAQSNWGGWGQGSQQEIDYAGNVAGVPATNTTAKAAAAAGSGGTVSAVAKTSPKRETQTLQGLAGVLQQLDGLLNPQGPGVGIVASVASLGTADVASSVVGFLELFLVRTLFTVAFGAITYLGVKTLTGTGGGSVNIINTLQRSNEAETARLNAETRRADVERKAAPGYGTTTRHNIEEQRVTKRTDVVHHRASENFQA